MRNAEFRHPVLGRSKVVAVEIEDLQPRQDFYLASGHRVDDLRRVAGRLSDHSRTDIWLDVVEFVVQCRWRDPQLVFHSLIGSMDGGASPA